MHSKIHSRYSAHMYICSGCIYSAGNLCCKCKVLHTKYVEPHAWHVVGYPLFHIHSYIPVYAKAFCSR